MSGTEKSGPPSPAEAGAKARSRHGEQASAVGESAGGEHAPRAVAQREHQDEAAADEITAGVRQGIR
jgi:hypothetical protein